MSRLTELMVENFRRFGPSQRVTFGEGATIIWAPNGTGKTALFEALELALTGGVNRLGENLSPLIRDGAVRLRVEVAFEDTKRALSLNRDGSARFTGSLPPDLSATDDSRLSNLLRLTHLLDQRSERWLIHLQDKDAGGRLNHLPVGRDAVRAYAGLRATYQAANKLTELANKTREERREAVRRWTDAVRERDAAAASIDGNLVPLSTLAERAGFGSDDVQVEALSTHCARRRAACSTQIHDLTLRLERLAEWETRLAAYAQALTAQEVASEAQRIAETTLSSAADQLRDAREHQRQRDDGVTKAAEGLAAASQTVRQYEERARLDSELEVAQGELATANALLDTVRATKAAEQANLNQLLQQRATWSELDQRERGLQARMQALESERGAVADLHALRQQLDGVELELENSTHAAARAEEAHRNAASLQAELDHAAAAAAAALESATASVGELRTAVRAVVQHTPPDRDTCPVCMEAHGAERLRSRMTDALERIDPILAEQTQQVRQATQRRDAARSALPALKVDADNASAAAEALRERLEALRQRVASLEREFPVTQRPGPDQGAYFSMATERIRTEREALVAARAAAGDRVGEGALAHRKDALEQVHTQQQEVEARCARARTAIHQLQARRQTLSEGLTSTIEHAVGVEQDCARALSEATAARDAGRTDIDRLTRRWSEAQGDHEAATTKVRSCADVCIGHEAAWRALDFAGPPDKETLESAQDAARVQRTRLRAEVSDLDDALAELARWRVAERVHRAQAELDRLRGARTEQDHTAALVVSLAQAEHDYAVKSDTATALKELRNALQTELDGLKERVQRVTPLWQSLLARVVREPRFAQTELRYFSRYNKDHANFAVPLHNGDAKAEHIASECQLTDLQLTFLLAMARAHPWCGWKGLLLDDPTQHHDMVHASAVFDVLRDYIADYGFQVVMTTHDQLQARFFMRKLRNDGLPATLWTLRQGPDGVQAYAERQTVGGRDYRR